MDEIDRILSNEPVVRPSAGFQDRVMRAVREEAAAPEPIEFPWRRFLPGAIAGAGLLAVALVAAIAGAPTPANMISDLPALPGALLRDVAIAAGALLGCALVAGMAVRGTSGASPRF